MITIHQHHRAKNLLLSSLFLTFARRSSSLSMTSSGSSMASTSSYAGCWSSDDDYSSQALQHCFLPLSSSSHKGSSGRVGIVGGSARYTGAPYYAGMAALTAGSDLVYIFCAQEAALPIKTYSPELMVTPCYNTEEFENGARLLENNDTIITDNSSNINKLIQSFLDPIVELLPRMHSLVVGPGLGRCPLVLEATSRLIEKAKTHGVALILDADALYMLSLDKYKHLIQDYDKVVLTPNVVELKRLVDCCDNGDITQLTRNGIIIQKGHNDVILKGGQEVVMTCTQQGGLKRSGGLGDVLAGCCATFLAWNSIMHNSASAAEKHRALACWSACCVTKEATNRAFSLKRRAMTAPDVLEQIGPAMTSMEEEVTK